MFNMFRLDIWSFSWSRTVQNVESCGRFVEVVGPGGLQVGWRGRSTSRPVERQPSLVNETAAGFPYKHHSGHSQRPNEKKKKKHFHIGTSTSWPWLKATTQPTTTTTQKTQWVNTTFASTSRWSATLPKICTMAGCCFSACFLSEYCSGRKSFWWTSRCLIKYYLNPSQGYRICQYLRSTSLIVYSTVFLVSETLELTTWTSLSRTSRARYLIISLWLFFSWWTCDLSPIHLPTFLWIRFLCPLDHSRCQANGEAVVRAAGATSEGNEQTDRWRRGESIPAAARRKFAVRGKTWQGKAADPCSSANQAAGIFDGAFDVNSCFRGTSFVSWPPIARSILHTGVTSVWALYGSPERRQVIKNYEEGPKPILFFSFPRVNQFRYLIIIVTEKKKETKTLIGIFGIYLKNELWYVDLQGAPKVDPPLKRHRCFVVCTFVVTWLPPLVRTGYVPLDPYRRVQGQGKDGSSCWAGLLVENGRQGVPQHVCRQHHWYFQQCTRISSCRFLLISYDVAKELDTL